MYRDADNLADVQWLAQCAHRLREQWPHADATSLDEAAAELWQNESLRSLEPRAAADLWLQPVKHDRRRPT
jgi:hypothetical protein